MQHFLEKTLKNRILYNTKEKCHPENLELSFYCNYIFFRLFRHTQIGQAQSSVVYVSQVSQYFNSEVTESIGLKQVIRMIASIQ